MDIEKQQKREKLNRLLREEKDLTAKWYERISGDKLFSDGEKERIDRHWNQVAAQVNKLQAEIGV